MTDTGGEEDRPKQRRKKKSDLGDCVLSFNGWWIMSSKSALNKVELIPCRFKGGRGTYSSSTVEETLKEGSNNRRRKLKKKKF